MKKIFSILVLSLLLALTGCGGSSAQGENNSVDSEINVFLPGEYINEEIIKSFEKETGIRVNITTFDSNEAMYIKLLGGTVYDVIIPSDYMIEKLIEEKMLQPLNKELIPNLDSLYDGVKNMSYDPDNTYSVPYFWGNVGIVYDTRKIDQADVEKEGWEIFHDTKYKGLMYFYDSERDEFMIALKALGYSMNTDSDEELQKAFEWLSQVSTTMEPAIVTDEAIDGLAYPEESDEKYFGMMYSGDAAYILSENENAKFYVPKEGTNYFVDAMCVHAESDKLEESCEFINYVLGYDAAYENSAEIGYSSCNKEVLNDLATGDFEGNDAYLPRAKSALDEEFHSNDEVRKIISDYWVRVKGQASE